MPAHSTPCWLHVSPTGGARAEFFFPNYYSNHSRGVCRDGDNRGSGVSVGVGGVAVGKAGPPAEYESVTIRARAVRTLCHGTIDN